MSVLNVNKPEPRQRGMDMSEETGTETTTVQSGHGRGASGGATGPYDDWVLRYEGWNEDQEPLREALCTLGNGLFATRGALECAPRRKPHYPGTYMAGGYDRGCSEVAGRRIENEDFVNWPDWLPLTWRIQEEPWFDPRGVRFHHYVQELDMRIGVVRRRMVMEDERGRLTRLQTRRIAHMGEPHCLALQWALTPLNWSGPITIRSGCNGAVRNGGVERYRPLESRHLEVLETGAEEKAGVYLEVRTLQSRIRMAQAALTCVYGDDGKRVDTRRETVVADESAAELLRLEVQPKRTLVIEKKAALYTSRDFAVGSPLGEARNDAQRRIRFDTLLASQVREWDNIWRRCDIRVEDGGMTPLVLRLHVFHLMQTASLNTVDRDVGVPPRGLHGEAYRGHIMWDELFVFPFLNLRIPTLTREFLMYRYRRLDAARRAAQRQGYRGAMYPWQSGSNGREESQTVHLNPLSGGWIPDRTRLQRHVNSAVAWNIWQYYQHTEDSEFLNYFGAEMFLEIAKFWSSKAVYDRERDRYEIRDVVGPDEYHTQYPGADRPGLRNNAYTNVTASWVLRHAPRILNVLDRTRGQELLRALEIDGDELMRWHRISTRMCVPLRSDGVIEQFEGYDNLRELDWEKYRRRYGETMRLDRILDKEGDDVNNYKAGKQADVLMLLYLFTAGGLVDMFRWMRYEFRTEYIQRNIDYYRRRTSHGSTLSRLVYSWVISRSNRAASWEEFRKALAGDIDDVQGGTTPEGIHLGAMAGTVDIMQRCYLGIEVSGNVLSFNPALPEPVRRISLRLRYRRQWVLVEATHESLTLRLEDGSRPRMRVRVRGEDVELPRGRSRRFDFSSVAETA